ncbi:MAG: MBL fold metallo-hydrolase, partial [Clostridia bacterium]|nr:MBL fold metallo-hydrolase [Clostridia bacterium]
ELKDMGVDKIDYIYITHFHTDHVGGLETFCKSDSGIDMSGATVFLPEDPPTAFTSTTVSECRAIVYDCAFKNQMEIIIPGKPNRTLLSTGENSYSILDNTANILPANFALNKFSQLKLDFKNLDTAYYYTETDTKENTNSNKHNNSSLCCIMTYGKTRIGFFGDISNKAQEHLYHNEEIGHLDLMNVEHHGKNGGFYRPFYDAIAPKMCFTQDGRGLINAGKNLLATRTKTQAYLQENNIPNYAVSVNGTMTFDIYKSGISTKANAVKYANDITGATSIIAAINNTTPDYGFTLHDNKKLSVLGLLKNMEHGTMLSTKLSKNSWSERLWNTLLYDLVEDSVTDAELIIYKGGSSSYNQSESGKDYPDSGYIVLFPHVSSNLSNIIVLYWYADKNFSSVSFNLKPLSNTEYFSLEKSANGTSFSDTSINTDVLSTGGLEIKPKQRCLINYTLFLQNRSNEELDFKFFDGEYERTINLTTEKRYATINNLLELDIARDEKGNIFCADRITLDEQDGVFARITGYVTYSKTRSKTVTVRDDLCIDVLPANNAYPQF